MALALRSTARATPPHLPSLAATLAPLLALANAGSFLLRYQDGAVIIEQAAFTGVNLVSVDAAIAAAPTATDQLDAQTAVDTMGIFTKAILLTLLDEINILRTNAALGLSARTVPQAIAAVRTKAGTL